MVDNTFGYNSRVFDKIFQKINFHRSSRANLWHIFPYLINILKTSSILVRRASSVPLEWRKAHSFLHKFSEKSSGKEANWGFPLDDDKEYKYNKALRVTILC
jgi:hypothetical protein